jgi:hypothetical protein
MLSCSPALVPQDDLCTPASPSRTRSADATVVGEALSDDVRTSTLPRGAVESRATSPPVVDSRVETPPCTVEAGGASGGDIGAMTSPRVIDVDPISAVPGGAEDLVRDHPQIDQVQGGLGNSDAQVPRTSFSSPRLPQREILWNHNPWHDDIFEDNEDMQALRTSIVTINHALTVSMLFDVLFLLMILLECC